MNIREEVANKLKQDLNETQYVSNIAIFENRYVIYTKDGNEIERIFTRI